MAFPETSYGILKRLRVIEGWTAALAVRLKRDRLSILDVGCGTGDLLTAPLADGGHEVIGVDFHALSIEEASRRHMLPNLAFRCCQLEQLVEDESTYDLVICSEVLEHVHRPADFLAALRRLVQPDGALIITTPNGYGSYEMLCRLQRLLEWVGIDQLLRRIVHARRQAKARDTLVNPAGETRSDGTTGFLNVESGHVQFFRASVLAGLFEQAGFVVAERRARTVFCGPYIDVLLRLPSFRQRLYRLNDRLADLLPFSWSADWMFLLRPRTTRGA